MPVSKQQPTKQEKKRSSSKTASQEFFTENRKKFVATLEDNSVAIIVGSNTKLRNGDAEYKFRQNSDCYYLSGINEPSVVLVFEKLSNNKFNYHIFAKVLSKEQLAWVSTSINLENAVTAFGADKAYNITEFDSIVAKIIKNKKVYYSSGLCKYFDGKIAKLIDTKKALDPKQNLHKLRLIKTEHELDLMRKAASISAAAHNKLIQFCQADMHEYQLEAKFNYEVNFAGARDLAYTSIVGGGNNAATLHYIKNDDVLNNGDLVLIDAGAEYNNYASDITRVFPVSGNFTPQQKDLYEVVLQAQKTGIEAAYAGNTWEKLHSRVVETLTAGLVDLKIISASLDEAIEKGLYKDFFMHYTGHWLGLDVHDCSHLKSDSKSMKFEPNMVITVEPGIYISKDNNKAPEQWRGIGIRIEDDICITKDKPEVLSIDAVKEVSEIEKLRKTAI